MGNFVHDIGAVMHAATIVVGDQLGLYKEMAKGPGTAEELAKRTETDPRYPLLQTIHGQGRLGIENIVLLQVESLGTSTLEREADDGWVMPYLHDLAQQGLYFPNVIQSFSATDGSTFATATSLHRTFGPSDGVSHFLPNEVNGHDQKSLLKPLPFSIIKVTRQQV